LSFLRQLFDVPQSRGRPCQRGFSIVNSQGGESRNPALSAKADAEKIMIKMSSLLGFDPVSRRRNPVETEEEDELDRLE
jgi:phage terminase small subunit